ncbi:hypothetical protein I317_06273 [Kwoniella heveanensis CBS 569]|nr:hypothetical protein I317_06273 [Kwoniella heveanensis CBS 569]
MSSTGPSSEERSAVAHASPNGSQTVQVTHRSIEPSFGRTTMHRYVDLEQDISDDIDNCEYSDTVLGFPSGPDEKFKVVGASFLPDTAAGKSHFLECPGDLPSELKDTLRQWERDAIHSICQGSNSAGGSPTSEIKKGRNGLLLTEGMILDLKQATWVGSQPGEKKTQGGMVFYQYSAGTDADYPKEWTREVASRLYPADCNVEDAVQSFVEGSQK